MPKLKNSLLRNSIAFMLFVSGFYPEMKAENLVILHSNDTHSQIDPLENTNLGGVLRRKAAIDSVRAVEPNVILVDAGDAVQGSLFFYLYAGEVESRLMNRLGVDYGILGNHEFDNGMESLSKMLKMRNDELLSTNYFLEDTPLKDLFKKYSIREIDGRRIGFIGINLDPKGMIADENAEGVIYSDALRSADLAAKFLKEIEKVDAVIALTHLGYRPETPPGDVMLAEKSEYIDVIIGGHSHTVLDPSSPEGYEKTHFINSVSRPVLVTQTGKAGSYLGKITINLDSIGEGRPVRPEYELITIDSRFDSHKDPEMLAIINEYRPGVDSLMSIPVSHARKDFRKNGVEELNFMADFIFERGRQISPEKVDFAIINKGGIRTDLPKGTITKGQIINLLPFQNKIVILEIKGKELREVFDVMATTGGNGVSSQVFAEFDPKTQKSGSIFINGKPLEDNKTYFVATIDYLANGGDYMTSLKNGKIIAEGNEWLYDELVNWLSNGTGKKKEFGKSSSKPRMVSKK